jgi:hypothetical protein
MLPCANFEVKFVKRQVNSVAHTLARAANSWSSFHIFEIIPSCIASLIKMHQVCLVKKKKKKQI